MDNELAGQCRLLLATVVSLVADEVIARLENRLITEDRVMDLAERQASAMFIDDRGDFLPRAWSKETLLTLISDRPTLDHEYLRQTWSKQQLNDMIEAAAWTQKQIEDMVDQKTTNLFMVDEDRVKELIDENNLDEDRVQEMIDNSIEVDDKIEEYLSNNLEDEVTSLVRTLDFRVTLR